MNQVQKDNGRKIKLHTAMSDLRKPELFTSQSTVINREVFTILRAFSFVKVGNKKNSHSKKSSDFTEKKGEVQIP